MRPLSFGFLAAKTVVESLWELGLIFERRAENTAYELSLVHKGPELDFLPVPLWLLLASQQHDSRMTFLILKSKQLQQWAALFSETIPWHSLPVNSLPPSPVSWHAKPRKWHSCSLLQLQGWEMTGFLEAFWAGKQSCDWQWTRTRVYPSGETHPWDWELSCQILGISLSGLFFFFFLWLLSVWTGSGLIASAVFWAGMVPLGSELLQYEYAQIKLHRTVTRNEIVYLFHLGDDLIIVRILKHAPSIS